jgi:hypothetical protein
MPPPKNWQAKALQSQVFVRVLVVVLILLAVATAVLIVLVIATHPGRASADALSCIV